MMKKSIGLIGMLLLLAVTPFYAFAGESGAQREIKGIVQSMPSKKVGVWKINGVQVKVTPQTKIDEKECLLKIGVMAEAEGIFQGKILLASELECESPEEKKAHD